MKASLHTYTDAALIELYRLKNDTVYVGELYKRYSVLVYGLCYKYLKDEHDAEDAVTEIFEIILEKLKSHEVGFFRSWLFMVCKHHLIRKSQKNNHPGNH
jgi:RNA polymerase sigma factor (sigma-70 family)